MTYGKQKEKFGICDENTLGSAYGCDICLPDKGVKKKHALVYYKDGGIFIQPLGRCVVLVNDELVRDAYALKTGDIISLGSIELRVFLKRKRVGNDY